MCTDISNAGKKKGIGRRTRSGLTWRHLFRLIRGLRPHGLVIENVAALRSMGADRCIGALERIGYACWPVVVGAEHAGAPHKRHRVFIIGKLADTPRGGLGTNGSARNGDRHTDIGGEAMADAECGAGGRQGRQRRSDRLQPDGQDAGRIEGTSRFENGGPATTADAAIARCEGHDAAGGTRASGRIAEHGRGIGAVANPIGGDCGGGRDEPERGPQERITARWPSPPGRPQFEWEAPRLAQFSVGAATGRTARRLVRLANRCALKAAGNIVVPQVAEMIGIAIKQVFEEKP
jgi:DNA (cytosine-5)-methyltransferase 1